jgi:hypothetical protein
MSSEAVIERERAWATPAAIAAFAAVALLVGSLIARTSIPSSSNSGAQLEAFHAHPGALVFSSILSGVGFALFSLPLAFLFRAARDRNPRIQPALIALCFIGPILIGAQGVINGIGLKKAAADYVAMGKPQPKSLAAFRKDLDAQPPTISKVNVYTDANQLEVETTKGDFYSVSYPQSKEKDLIGAADASSVSSTSLIGAKSAIDNSVDSGGQVGDAGATKAADDNSTVKLAANLIFPAALAMIFAVIYTALQSYRVGLLTRFFGTLGMALGAALILLPQAPIFIALWLGWLGLIFINRVPGGRPPAWDAGEAVPWPPTGAAAAKKKAGAGDSGTIEGTARDAEAANGNARGGAGAARRKRKRRR